MLRPHDLPLPQEQGEHHGLILQLRRGEHVRLGLLGEDGHLLLVQPLDGPYLVPEPGGPLELQVFGRFRHLAFQFREHLLRAPLQEGDDLLHVSVIGLPAHLAGAGGAALADVVHEAGALPSGDGPGHVLPAGADGEVGPDDGHLLPQDDGRQVGPEIGGPVLAYAAHHLHPGKVLLEVDPHVGEVLIVLQEDVVLGHELLDEVALQGEGFHLVGHADGLEVRDMADHGPDLGRVVLARLEVLADPVLQAHGLAHVYDRTPIVQHLVDAGGIGQELQFVGDYLVHRTRCRWSSTWASSSIS